MAPSSNIFSLLALLSLLIIPSLSLSKTPCELHGSCDPEPDCTTSQLDTFATTLKTTLSEIQKALSLLSKFTEFIPNFRQRTAIQDCVDLLDLSSDELTWTLSQTPNSGVSRPVFPATGRRKNDVATWLSAALGNQDTCLDGFEGTDGVVKELILGSLVQVTGLVGEILGMVKQIATVPLGKPLSGAGKQLATEGRRLMGGFPSWFPSKDRRLLQIPVGGVAVNATVAADGTGNYTTVTDAITAAPDHSEQRYVIYVKKGVYNENLEVKKKKTNIMLIGDGKDVTVITGNRNFVDGWTTFRSATFAVSGNGFIARGITFENSAGPEKHQAVAARVDSDLSAFYQCSFKGFQDTLYAHSLRQFYRDCDIFGTVDFIFGNAAAIFQNCRILPRKPLPNQKNSITAHGRKDPNQITGFSIQFCNISGDPELFPTKNSTETYLGRPWKQYSRTVIMQSYMSDVIHPQGWLAWQGDFALDTLYYGEYMNYGPGAGLGGRVKWPGYRAMGSVEATNFTVTQFIDGGLWLPATGVKFTAGLSF
ncbi:hypothetical protein AMTRI_Chr13g84480 [Amborella trichopoda]